MRYLCGKFITHRAACCLTKSQQEEEAEKNSIDIYKLKRKFVYKIFLGIFLRHLPSVLAPFDFVLTFNLFLALPYYSFFEFLELFVRFIDME